MPATFETERLAVRIAALERAVAKELIRTCPSCGHVQTLAKQRTMLKCKKCGHQWTEKGRRKA